MKRYFQSALAAMALGTSPVAAQDAATDTTKSDDTETASLLAYLGLTAADGSNTVAEGTGQIEGQMLASLLAVKAAQSVEDQIKDDIDGKTVVLLHAKQPFDLLVYYDVSHRLSRHQEAFAEFKSEAHEKGCLKSDDLNSFRKDKSNEQTSDDDDDDEKSEFKFKVSDFLGAARVSSAFSPVSLEISNQLMQNALSSKIAGTVLPSEMMMMDENDQIGKEHTNLTQQISPYAKGQCDKSPLLSDEVKKSIKAQAASLLTSLGALDKGKDGKPSALQLARRVATFAQEGSDLRILRFNVEKAGGTLVSSSSVFTSLGLLPGMTMRGGLVMTYRLLDPKKGTVEKAGVLSCRFPIRVLKSITSNDLPMDEAKCQSLL